MTKALYAMVTAQGTACSETALCTTHKTSQCMARYETRYCDFGGADPDAPLPGSWTNCSDNSALVCSVCGFYPHPSRYVIRSLREEEVDGPFEGDPLFWSNDQGWVDFASATVFERWERDRLRLPAGGAWHRVSNASLSPAVEQVADALWAHLESLEDGRAKRVMTSVASFLSCLAEDLPENPEYAADVREGTLSGLVGNIQRECK